jgi:hypothetical protein
MANHLSSVDGINFLRGGTPSVARRLACHFSPSLLNSRRIAVNRAQSESSHFSDFSLSPRSAGHITKNNRHMPYNNNLPKEFNQIR